MKGVRESLGLSSATLTIMTTTLKEKYQMAVLAVMAKRGKVQRTPEYRSRKELWTSTYDDTSSGYARMQREG